MANRKSLPHRVERVVQRVPGLRHVPVVVLVSAAEVALVARDHLLRLTPQERRRLVVLVRTGRGRPSRLTTTQQRELQRLLEKLDPREVFGDAVTRLSPVPVPRRVAYGPRRRRD